jgi:hypothetical protein
MANSGDVDCFESIGTKLLAPTFIVEAFITPPPKKEILYFVGEEVVSF